MTIRTIGIVRFDFLSKFRLKTAMTQPMMTRKMTIARNHRILLSAELEHLKHSKKSASFSLKFYLLSRRQKPFLQSEHK